MSVVIVTPDNYQVVRKTIRHLRAQTVNDCLEIVVAAPSEKELDLIESDLEVFPQPPDEALRRTLAIQSEPFGNTPISSTGTPSP